MKPAPHPFWKYSLFWTWFLPKKKAQRMATLGPVGYRLPAPGTWGSLLGCLWYLALFHNLPLIVQGILLVITSFIAAGICDKAEEAIGRRDPGEVILDEFVAMPLCFLGLRPYVPAEWFWVVLLAGFGLFRLFDIAKPFGINRLQHIHGGWGILLDDIAAALATLIVLGTCIALWRLAQ
ncbi:MAG: phosphatidylglycerophosphatase A [Verrucomicrobiota bacterium]|nr:phosphatidylglycerophosphatase A [Verrucomicrobiota bacterium]